ncbi:hypothetical protein CC80DRAFT_553889 [Byssothecium circinans]|uniref:Mid2 domain-containing protein n=1 Tax=Byssothecium circinans TaxID=147558 RepID=A0A6A5TEC9_9PLEO|nr:hypothetical protein CC80DRAFT_553889 [Byssothecium circinans]
MLSSIATIIFLLVVATALDIPLPQPSPYTLTTEDRVARLESGRKRLIGGLAGVAALSVLAPLLLLGCLAFRSKRGNKRLVNPEDPRGLNPPAANPATAPLQPVAPMTPVPEGQTPHPATGNYPPNQPGTTAPLGNPTAPVTTPAQPAVQAAGVP